MLQLRNDLILSPAREGECLLVREPESGAVFEFGEQEAFLIAALRKPYDPVKLMSAFNARFGVNDGVHELQEFLGILADWGLLEDRPGKSASMDGKDQHPDASTDHAYARVKHDDQDDDDAGIQRNNRWHLFRPEGLFDALDQAFSPLRKLVWLIPVLVVYSVIAIWFNRHFIVDSMATANLHFGLIGRFVFVAITVNLVVQLFRGVVARHYGMRVPSFGMVLAFGLIPRFNTQILPHSEWAKSERLWFASTSLWVQLALFTTGVTLWLTTRPSGSLLSTVGAELALVSAISFLLVANPLWGGDGYNLLAVQIESPNLRQRAKNSLKALFTGRPKVIAKYSKDSWTLAIFAVASIAFPVALFTFIAISAAQRLESNFQGAGVALFLVLLIYMTRHTLRSVRFRKEEATQWVSRGVFTQGQIATPAPVTLAQRASAKTAEPVTTDLARKSQRLRYLVAVLLIVILLLPYPYETGGIAHIFPVAQHEVYAETNGIIEQVHYSGGEWVTQGTVIAEMASHRQRKDVMMTQATIQAKQRDIDRLRSTPSAESIRLVEEQLTTARLDLRYSLEEANRFEKLFTKGMVSVQSYNDVKKQRDLHRQIVQEKRASLDALKVQINPNEIASAEAELQKLREDLVFYNEQLRRTRLQMPIFGRIATTKLQDLRNKYLEEGQLFCTVEDARQVRVEIAVPEAEIYEVTIGDRVRLKTWAEPTRIFSGTVAEIAPQATQETYGNIIMVMAILPNADLTLRTGMTGYAKIQGEKTLMGAAFTRALVRFFLIEVWSWLP